MLQLFEHIIWDMDLDTQSARKLPFWEPLSKEDLDTVVHCSRPWLLEMQDFAVSFSANASLCDVINAIKKYGSYKDTCFRGLLCADPDAELPVYHIIDARKMIL